jgi:hypothetical protein
MLQIAPILVVQRNTAVTGGNTPPPVHGVGLNISYYKVPRVQVGTLQMEQIRGSLPALVFTGTIVLTLLYKIILKSKPGVEISELWIYPIKSCKGIKVNSAVVTPRGFELDRWFMVVDQNGKFVSQRTFPQMALVSVTILDLPGMKMVGATTALRTTGYHTFTACRFRESTVRGCAGDGDPHRTYQAHHC